METSNLQKIGLNPNEVKIYLSLLGLGEAKAGKISKESQINRTTTYDSIERLIEKGLVTYTIEANRKVFKPVVPERLLDDLKEKQKIIEDTLPELNKLFHKSKEKEESDIYKGKKGIRSILNDILNHKEYVAFGSSGGFLNIMQHDFNIFQKKKKQSKINARIILSESSKEKQDVKEAFSKFKFISDEYSSPTTTFIYSNKTAIIVWAENPIATLITSKEVAESYKKHFELMWKITKK